jgi:hypothetical protein
MEEGDILMIDATVCDVLVQDTQVEREHVHDPTETEGGISHPRLFITVDRFSRLVVACRLSYEEMESDG